MIHITAHSGIIEAQKKYGLEICRTQFKETGKEGGFQLKVKADEGWYYWCYRYDSVNDSLIEVI